MKSKAIIILRETIILWPLAIISALGILAFGIVSRVAISYPLFRILIFVLAYIMVLCGAMILLGVRKWRKLIIRAILSGVIAAGLLVASAERFPDVLVFAKVALGEGGIVHKVGEARLNLLDSTITYSVYCGNVKYANGSNMRELILVANDPVPRESFFHEQTLLVGKSSIDLAHGLSCVRVFPGHLAVTCLGGIDVTSGKAGVEAKVSSSNSGASRSYRCELYVWDKKLRRSVHKIHFLEVPLSCFNDLDDESREEESIPDTDSEDWTAAARFVAGPEFLGRALGEQMPCGDEYDVKLEHPFLFLPRASYFGAADGGIVRVKGCVLWFKSPSVEYAIENVLSPITNALIKTFGVPLVMSPETKRGMFWNRAFSAAHKGLDIEMQVVLEGHGRNGGDTYESCLLMISVMDAYVRRCGDLDSERNWWRLIKYYRGNLDPISVDDWHELSADSVNRRRQFSRTELLCQPDGSYIQTPTGREALCEYASRTFGIPFDIDVRTIDYLGGESILPTPGAFLALEPKCEISTNGWHLMGVDVNGRALTVFGGTVRREFSNEADAKADLKRVIAEIEGAANRSMKMSVSADDKFFASTSSGSDPFIGIKRIRTAADGSSSYQVHVTRHSLMKLMHIMTSNGCNSRPE